MQQKEQQQKQQQQQQQQQQKQPDGKGCYTRSPCLQAASKHSYAQVA
jgi:hypothetical protein